MLYSVLEKSCTTGTGAIPAKLKKDIPLMEVGGGAIVIKIKTERNNGLNFKIF